MFFLEIDDRFLVAPSALGSGGFGLVTDAFGPAFVIPDVVSFQLEAQVVDGNGLVRFVDQTPREVTINVELPVPSDLAFSLRPDPLGLSGFGFTDSLLL